MASKKNAELLDYANAAIAANAEVESAELAARIEKNAQRNVCAFNVDQWILATADRLEMERSAFVTMCYLVAEIA